MHISFIDIQNYRRLKEIRIDFSETQSLFVGANNSGKTSAMDALISFLTDKSTIHTIDFTITNWTIINSIGEAWESLTEKDEDRLVDIERWRNVLPTLDLWFKGPCLEEVLVSDQYDFTISLLHLDEVGTYMSLTRLILLPQQIKCFNSLSWSVFSLRMGPRQTFPLLSLCLLYSTNS